MIHLVTGGARSGKSRHAQAAAEALPGAHLRFVATAEPLDDDMAERIRRHQEDRGPRWRTTEEPVHVDRALADADAAALLLDCLTLWTSNQLFAHAPGEAPEDAAVLALAARQAAAFAADPRPTWVVTNEVGLGIVPGDALSRRYRDLLGRVNQLWAAQAETVTFLVAGLPLRVK